MVLGLSNQLGILEIYSRFGVSRAVVLDISKTFDKVLHAFLLHKSYGVLGQIFGHCLPFLSNGRLRVVVDGKCTQEFPVNIGVPQGSILVLHFSYYTLMTFVMLLPMLMILLFTLIVIKHLVCGKKYNLQKLESDLRDTVKWDRKCLLDFNPGKLSLLCLTDLLTLVLLMRKLMGLLLKRNYFLK